MPVILGAPNVKPELESQPVLAQQNHDAVPPSSPALGPASSLAAPAAGPKPNLLPPSPALTPVPAELTRHMEELEQWAQDNRRDARNDAIAFWSLKLPAIVSAASAGVLGHLQFSTASLYLAGIASFCALVDGLHPRGLLRNVHHRAWLDIRDLTASMAAKWRSRRTGDDPQSIAATIIGETEKERRRISKFIADAESALKYK